MNRNLDKLAARYEMCMEAAEALVRNSHNRVVGGEEPAQLPESNVGDYVRVTGSVASSLFIEMNKRAGAWDEGFGLPSVPEGAAAQEMDDPLWPRVLPCRSCSTTVDRRPSKYNTEVNPYYYKCGCGVMSYSQGYTPKAKR